MWHSTFYTYCPIYTGKAGFGLVSSSFWEMVVGRRSNGAGSGLLKIDPCPTFMRLGLGFVSTLNMPNNLQAPLGQPNRVVVNLVVMDLVVMD